MFKYILKRILFFIPTLFIISVFTFGLSKIAPGDPVELRMAGGMGGSQGGLQEQQAGEQAYFEMRQKLGLDIPSFYASLTSQAYPDSLYKIMRKKERDMLDNMIDEHGNWPQIETYYNSIKDLEQSMFLVDKNDNTYDRLQIVKENINELLLSSDDIGITNLLTEMETEIFKIDTLVLIDSAASPALNIDASLAVVDSALLDSFVTYTEIGNMMADIEVPFNTLKSNYTTVKEEATPSKKYIPSFHWYGLNNQYHVWLFGNRPWFADNDEVLSESFDLETTKTIDVNPQANGFYDIDMNIDVDGDVEDRDKVLMTISYDVDGSKRTREYTYKNLEDIDFAIGSEYIDKNGYTAGQSVAITLENKSDYAISGDVEINQVHNYDPNKIRGGFFRLDFGESYLDGRPVKSILFDALPITIKFNLIAVFLAYFISIPLGVGLSVNKDTALDRITTTVLFILYSLPSFWVATMAVVFFTTPDYGDWTNLFPTYGLHSQGIDSKSFFVQFLDSVHHMILPIICMTYGSFTFISRQMRGGMISVIKQDYIRTAKAKGLSFGAIIWKHAFRNSLIPIVTMFASIFPVMISGSVVIEVIFNLPGMGNIGYGAVVARNYPVLFTILMFSAILTMVGMLMADLLYSVVDPRISFNKKGS